uniref:SKI family transcriptional corepressor 2 isoform X1 n=2 Tax=Doryrhamphus excisus TaxID=161450 RepID=UPI0025ADD512|nr:SKI family transcriptional corepressor 2 isoform X1 [Doryrhamphus excisus]XP_057906671.1 SKI family transcriptional corepressor 2 isoform X1 [Doryrhamphus excisus]XP_057906681.1 SKI family transcriptional corepressor 2 isoform X1 [Doryrhamphus excisus]XP_057906692.1 SKI family transcriptional corepressor 2 isoform X1 [Doryrhamphus excisus]XP_057906701.1 SKI family transcriptional corepressor 2 isoform X1 [Doryrhamphus excisus]XP_057906710.1 SKI family transcriptional corepressor 2 isoform X
MDKSHLSNPNDIIMTSSTGPYPQEAMTPPRPAHLHSSSSLSSPSPSSSSSPLKPNQVGQVFLYSVPIVSLVIDNIERLCLAQISNTLLKNYSYNEIHNRRVALGITCVQCTPVQLEILRRAGAMPISSRRCGMITKREAERLCKSFLGENMPPKLPDNFAFDVTHECAWGCRGNFIPARYNSSRAKCIKCSFCNMYFSPNKFIFHSHRTPDAKYTQPDAANFNSWRRHLKLSDKHPADELVYAWEDVKAMFNGGSRKRALPSAGHCPSLGPMKPLPGSVVPHLMGGDLGAQKRAHFEDEEDLDAGGLSPRKTPRYPVIPVPSKSFGMLQKFPPTSLFPSPYPFPAFGLCQQKKEDNDVSAGHKGTGLSGLLWPGRKDTFYPPFCMFWPPRAAGGIPMPTYLQPQPSLSSLADNPSLRQAFLDLSDSSEPGAVTGTGNGANTNMTPSNGSAASRSGLFDPDCMMVNPELRPVTSESWLKLLDNPTLQTRKPSYGSAFRPVVKDAESIAKLHSNGGGVNGAADEEIGVIVAGSDRHSRLSPSSSCSYASESGGEGEAEGAESEEDGEVDVESSKQDDEEDEGSFTTRLPQTNLFLPAVSNSGGEERDPIRLESPSLPASSPASLPLSSSTPPHREDPTFKNVDKNRNEGLPAYATKDSAISDENKEQNIFFGAEHETSAPDTWRESSGDQSQGAASPVSLKKDVENMEKEELQKVLLEQIDFRRRLEQEFHALKGTSPFPVFHNFQDQMKRELAYREEMVQQLQMIPYANIIRKDKISSHLNK